jgi:hypothetical protein
VIRFIVIPLAALALVGLQCSLVRAAPFTDSYLDGATWNRVYAQGFSPAVLPNPDPSLPFTEPVSLSQFQFFKSGTADSIGTASGPASVQLAILSNIYADLTNLSTSSPVVVGLSTNSITSTAAIPLGAPITFTFNGLPLRFGSSYGAVVVSNNGGVLTPVLISALTANYALQADSNYHPVTNYGGETDYNWSTSNFIQTNSFGSFFFGFSYGGDANFVATMNHVVHGDFNGDGQVNAADLPAMLSALTDLDAYQTTNHLASNDLVTLADFNGDGAVTNADIQPFLDYLAASGFGAGAPTAVPEPSSAVLLIGGILIFWRGSAVHRQRQARSSSLVPQSGLAFSRNDLASCVVR